MRTASSTIFFLLEKEFASPEGGRFRYPGGLRPGVEIMRPRLFDGPEIEAGFLYISDRPEILDALEGAGASAFLLSGAASAEAARRFPESGGAGHAAKARIPDLALAGGDVPPLSLFDAAVRLFIELRDQESRLKDAALDVSGGYDRLFRIGREFFDLPFTLIDRNFITIASTPDFYPMLGEKNLDRTPVEAVSAMLVRDAERYYAVSEFTEPYYWPSDAEGVDQWLCCNIFRGSRFEGRIVAIMNKAPHPGRLEILALLCKYAGKMFIESTAAFGAKRQNDALHRLLRDCISAPDAVREGDILPVLEEFSWRKNGAYILAVFEIADGRRFAHGGFYICRHLETEMLHSCALASDSRIIWLVNTEKNAPGTAAGDFGQSVAFVIREFNCRAGISKTFGNFPDVSFAWLEALAALRLGEKRQTCRFEDFVLDYILERAAGEIPPERLLHPALSILRDLDRKNGTVYEKSLRGYLDSRYGMALAAEKLFIHRTTLIRRLERITEITGLDFDRPEEMLHLAVSLRFPAEKEP